MTCRAWAVSTTKDTFVSVASVDTEMLIRPSSAGCRLIFASPPPWFFRTRMNVAISLACCCLLLWLRSSGCSTFTIRFTGELIVLASAPAAADTNGRCSAEVSVWGARNDSGVTTSKLSALLPFTSSTPDSDIPVVCLRFTKDSALLLEVIAGTCFTFCWSSAATWPATIIDNARASSAPSSPAIMGSMPSLPRMAPSTEPTGALAICVVGSPWGLSFVTSTGPPIAALTEKSSK